MEREDKDRLSTLGELSAILAHEMKNPMNSIIINLETLRSTILELTKSDPTHQNATRARKYVEAIEGEIRRLDKVLRGFLDFANPSESTKIRFKINPVIQSLLDFLHLEFKQSQVQLDLDLAEDVPALFGSPDQFKQALLNLMLNSSQAMPQGGTLSVRTEANGTHIRIVVEDTGVGIGPAAQEKIFDPYFTTKEKGSGLGLTIVRRVVRDHGGEIKVSSEVNKGTRFEISIPGVIV
jgi:two-component system, sporulation sensor kinase E